MATRGATLSSITESSAQNDITFHNHVGKEVFRVGTKDAYSGSQRGTSIVNNFETIPGESGEPVQLVARGNDADIDIDLVPKGAGVVNITGLTADPIVTDTINEKTPDAGVTVDGVLLKDGEVNTDIINEVTGSGNGVTVDGVLLKDGEVNTDIINEVPGSNNGVTIDGVLLKDGEIATSAIPDPLVLDTVETNVRLLTDRIDPTNPGNDIDLRSDVNVGNPVGTGTLAAGRVQIDNRLGLDTTGTTAYFFGGTSFNNSSPPARNAVLNSQGNSGSQVQLQIGNHPASVACVGAATFGSTYVEIDPELRVDTINELTGNAGVTIEGVLLKDGAVSGTPTPYITQTSWSPTLFNYSNLNSVSLNSGFYSRIGDVVFFKVDTTVDVIAAAAIASFAFAPPVPFGTNQNTHGTCNGYASISIEDVPALGRIDDGPGTNTDRIVVRFTTVATTGAGSCQISGWYWA